MSKRPNQANNIVMGDQVVIFRGNCTDFRVVPIDVLIKEIIEQIPQPEYKQPVIQPFNPNGNFTLYVDNNDIGTYLAMLPSSEIESGTIVLPYFTDVKDGQEVLVSSSQQINELAIDPNGAAVIGEPNNMRATGFFKLKYEQLSQTWYRVG